MCKSPMTATRGRRNWRNTREQLERMAPTDPTHNIQDLCPEECSACNSWDTAKEAPRLLVAGRSLKEERTNQGKMEHAEHTGKAAISHHEIKAFGILKTNILSLHSNLKSSLPWLLLLPLFSPASELMKTCSVLFRLPVIWVLNFIHCCFIPMLKLDLYRKCADQLLTLLRRVCVQAQSRWEKSFYLSWLKIQRRTRWRERRGGGERGQWNKCSLMCLCVCVWSQIEAW